MHSPSGGFSSSSSRHGYAPVPDHSPMGPHGGPPSPFGPEPELMGPSGKPKLTFSRLLQQAHSEWKTLTLATGALLCTTVLNLAIPAYVGKIIDAISDNNDKDEGNEQLLSAVLALVVISLLAGIFVYFRVYFFALAGERVVARLRTQLFSAIIKQEIGMFDATRTGELINRLSSDTTILKNSVTMNVSMSLRWAATIVGGILYLFIISWKLTLVMLSVVPLVAISMRFYGTYVRSLGKKTQDALAQATEVAEESIGNIRTVRAFARESYQEKMYSSRVEESFDLGVKSAVAAGTFMAILSVLAGGSMLLVMYYGGKLVLDGEMSSGTLISFVLYTITVGVALAGLSDFYGDIMRAMGSNERVFDLVDRIPAINIKGGYKPPYGSIRAGNGGASGLVQLENVHFSYPSRSTVEVLKDVSLVLRPGTVTALVGRSGSGKSTIAALIERFYDPTRGRILFDGRDIRDYDPVWLHRNMGVVTQEPVLFATSLRDNILYGVGDSDDNGNLPQVSHDTIVAAARAAHAHDFIVNFPEGYDTIVGERGIRLSGGQKQRVAIARAILMDPSVLLLDEATSALDAESEHLVQAALETLMRGRTVLVIAHRLSTVKNADNVVVLDEGRIAEQGTHEELLRANGLYAVLVRRQLQQA